MAKTRTLPDKYMTRITKQTASTVYPCGALQALRSTTPQPTFT